MNCPCGSSEKFETCCGPLLQGSRAASSPEELMRSRYTAYCLKNLDYIVATTHPQRRLEIDQAASRQWMESCTFTKLEVLRSTDEGNKGLVEFIAHFKQGDQIQKHHELSRFRMQAGVWYFHEGRVVAKSPN